MKKEQVREYIENYKHSYSRESIEKQLINHGTSKSDIDEVYRGMNNSIFPPNHNKKAKKNFSGLALGLVIAGLVVPFLGFFFKIVCIILGHRARSINKHDGMALAALIIGYIGLVFSLIILLIFGALIYSFVDQDSLTPNKIDLSGSLRADPINSIFHGDEFNLVFTYVGARLADVKMDGTIINDNINNVDCKPVSIKNFDTDSKVEEGRVHFLNGQSGMITFKCKTSYENGDLFEGHAKIMVENPKTTLKVPSEGNIRMSVSG